MNMKSLLLCNALAAVCCLCMTCAANAEVAPFGVDMYVKSPGPGYHIFRGTRSVATHYSEAGWSVGEMKNGRLCFNIADGSNHSCVSQPAVDTSWREKEWNHVAASYSGRRLDAYAQKESRARPMERPWEVRRRA